MKMRVKALIALLVCILIFGACGAPIKSEESTTEEVGTTASAEKNTEVPSVSMPSDEKATQGEGSASVDGKELSVGDTFTYTFNVSGAEQKIVGMQMKLFYDRNSLELIEATDGVIGGTTTINEDSNKDGTINFVNAFMNGGGLECKNKTPIVTATFRVLSDKNTDITYFIQYLYDYDLADIHTYTFTCDITSDGKTVKADVTPTLADKSLTASIAFDDNFKNTEEGKAKK